MDRYGIKSFIHGCRSEVLDILSALVAIPTINPPGKSYRRCVNYLSGLLKEWHITHDVIPVSAGQYPRFCILGEIGEGEESLHFHGHYDVVPAQSGGETPSFESESFLNGSGLTPLPDSRVVRMQNCVAWSGCFFYYEPEYPKEIGTKH